MDLYQELALLTDAEAELCLNGVLKGLVATQPDLAEAMAEPKEMAKAVQMTAGELGKPLAAVSESKLKQRPKALRVVLVQIAEDPTLRPRLEAWLTTARPKLLEPVTSALVLAGIIMILSTHVSVEYEVKNGKKNLRVKIEKKPTAAKILEKFFPFFGN